MGTRKATELGKKRVDTFLREIAEMGYRPNIISGLAYGIDIAAHSACIHYTLKAQAVLGHGLHMIYPASHKNIAEKIVEQGGTLLSEFPTCAQILPTNFLQRNRIVAGMSEAVLVAESPVKGGAMATARQASRIAAVSGHSGTTGRYQLGRMHSPGSSKTLPLSSKTWLIYSKFLTGPPYQPLHIKLH